MRKVGPPPGRHERQLGAALFILLASFLPTLLWAQGARPEDDIVLSNQNGLAAVLPGASVYTCAAGATVNFLTVPPCTGVQVYSDQPLTHPISQPIIADGNGNFTEYLPGCITYTLAIASPTAVGFSKQWTSPCVNATNPTFNNLTLTGTCAGCPGAGGGAALGANNAFTGNNTHSGTEGFSNLLQLAGGTCSVSAISAGITAVGTAGTVDARGCTVSFTWGSTLTISNPVTLYMPCANITFTAQLLAVTSDDVHIHFCGSGTSGQIANYATSTAGSTYTASGLSGSTNAIVAQKTTRGTQNAARISGFSLDGLTMNMNGVGNRAIYLSSAWSPIIQDVVVYGLNCSDGGVYQEADPASDGTLFAASYFARFSNVVSVIQQSNTACHPFYFDASNGEIAYGTYTNLFAEGYPQAAGSGSDSVYIVSGASNVNQSFDQNAFVNLKAQDPTTNKYGINLVGAGTYAGNSGSSFLRIGGSIFNVQFIDAQPERIFSTGGTGTGIGCTTNGTTAGGAGCAFIANNNFSGGGWGNNEDVANLGAGYLSVSDNAATLQGPMFRQSGLHQGSNSNFERVDPTYSPTANSQNGFSVAIQPNTANPNNFTGVGFQGLTVDMGDGTHTDGGTHFATAYGVNINGFCTSWVTTCWSLFASGGAGNHLDSWLEIGTASVSNPGGVTNGGRLWYNQAAQQVNTSNNNGTFFPLPQTGNTSGTHSDSGFYQTATAAGCTTAASIGGVCATAITLTWPTAFADANYKVNCTPVGAPTNLPSNPYIVTPIAASVTVNYYAITAAAASWPNVTCEAVHN